MTDDLKQGETAQQFSERHETAVTPPPVVNDVPPDAVEVEAAAAGTTLTSDQPTDETAPAPEPPAEKVQELVAETVDFAATLTEEVETLKRQLQERTNQFMRLQADFENHRRRSVREREELEEKTKGATIVELLPVIDNFERARSQIKPQAEGEVTIHKSYQSIYKQFVESLKRLGVAPMRAEGKPFDPYLHEAVMREPTAEHPDGTVIEELMRGYLLGERVLRHAMVKVAAPQEPVVTSEGAEPQGLATNEPQKDSE